VVAVSLKKKVQSVEVRIDLGEEQLEQAPAAPEPSYD